MKILVISLLLFPVVPAAVGELVLNSGACDLDDAVSMAAVWLSDDGQWDIAPVSGPDGTVDYFDFGLLSEFWNPTSP